jgi:hypothetical protein
LDAVANRNTTHENIESGLTYAANGQNCPIGDKISPLIFRNRPIFIGYFPIRVANPSQARINQLVFNIKRTTIAA